MSLFTRIRGRESRHFAACVVALTLIATSMVADVPLAAASSSAASLTLGPSQPTPDIGKLQIRATSQRQSIEVGETVSVLFEHEVVGNFFSGLRDVITVPEGLIMSPLVANGWVCPGGAGEVACVHGNSSSGYTSFSADFTAGPLARKGLTFIVVLSSSRTKVGSTATLTSLVIGSGSDIFGSASSTKHVNPTTKAHLAPPSTKAHLAPPSSGSSVSIPTAGGSGGFSPEAASDIRAVADHQWLHVSWSAAGSEVVQYHVTAEPGHFTCETTSTACDLSLDGASSAYSVVVTSVGIDGTATDAPAVTSVSTQPLAPRLRANASPYSYSLPFLGGTLSGTVIEVNPNNWTFTASGSSMVVGGMNLTATGSFTCSGASVATGCVGGTVSNNGLNLATSGTLGSLTIKSGTLAWDPSKKVTLTGNLTLMLTTGLDVALAVQWQNTSNWSVTGSGTTSLGGLVMTAAGTLTYTAGVFTPASSLTFAVSGVVGAVKVTSGSLAWKPNSKFGQPVLSGSVKIQIFDSVSVVAQLSYTDANSYQASFALANVMMNGLPLSINGDYFLDKGVVVKSSVQLTGSGSFGPVTVKSAALLWAPNQSNQPLVTGSAVVTVADAITMTTNLSYTSGSTYSLEGTGSFNLGSVKLSVSGKYVRSGGNLDPANHISLKGSGSFGPVDLKRVDLTWTPDQTKKLSGSVTLSIASALFVEATFQYQNIMNWQLMLKADATFSGLTLHFSGLEQKVLGILNEAVTVTGSGKLGPVTVTSASLQWKPSAPGGKPVIQGTLTAQIANAVNLNFTFEFFDNNDWQVTGKGTSSVFSSVNVALSGDITYKDAAKKYSGCVSLTATSNGGSVGGLSFKSGKLLWCPGTTATVVGPGGSGDQTPITGTLTLGLGSTTLDFGVSYLRSDTWSVTVNVAKKAYALTSLVSPDFTFSGKISSTEKGGVVASFTATATNVALTSSVTITTLTATLANSCPIIQNKSVCIGTNSWYFSLSGKASLSSFGVNLVALGVVGLDDGSFLLKVDVPGSFSVGPASVSGLSASICSEAIDGFCQGDPTAKIMSSMLDKGLTVQLQGTGSISVAGLSGSVTLTLNKLPSGTVVTATSQSLSIAGISIDTLIYNSGGPTLTAKVDGAVVTLAKGAVVLGGSYTLPDIVVEGLGLSSGSIPVAVNFTDATHWNISAVLASGGSLAGGTSSSGLSFDSFLFNVGLSGSSIVISATANGTFTSGTTSVPVSGSLTFDVNTLTITANFDAGTPNGVSAPVWNDVMGVSGLDMTWLHIGIGITFSTGVPLPSVTLGVSMVLPTSLLSALGATNDPAHPILVTGAISLDIHHPCIDLVVGSTAAVDSQGKVMVSQLGSAPNFIDISASGSSILTAKYAHLNIAPFGCDVGGLHFVPGFALGFDGSLFGSAVHVDASITFDPFTLQATVTMDPFCIAQKAVCFHGAANANDKLLMQFGVQNDVPTFTFSGAVDVAGHTLASVYVHVGDDKVAASASLSLDLSVAKLDLSVAGSFSSSGFSIQAQGDLAVAGKTVAGVMVAVAYDGSGFRVDFSGSVDVDLSVIKATATVAGYYHGPTDWSFTGAASFFVGFPVSSDPKVSCFVGTNPAQIYDDYLPDACLILNIQGNASLTVSTKGVGLEGDFSASLGGCYQRSDPHCVQVTVDVHLHHWVLGAHVDFTVVEFACYVDLADPTRFGFNFGSYNQNWGI